MGIFDISKKIREEIGEYPAPDERELTRHLLREMSQKSRVHFYTLTQNLEHDLGADWLWLVFTNAGAFGFLVQAKKLKHFGPDEIYDIRNKVRYQPAEGDYQIKKLMKTADYIGIPALYVFFSNVVDSFACNYMDVATDEGVFLDSAQNLHRFAFEEDIRTAKCPELMPLSCLFSSISKKCNYFGTDKLCRSCHLCSVYNDCTQENERRRIQKEYKYPVYDKSQLIRTKCVEPFENFLLDRYDLDCTPIKFGSEMYPLFWAESVMQEDPRLVLQCMKRLLSKQANPEKAGSTADRLSSLADRINNILICEYMNKHDEDYADALLGPDVQMDYATVYDKQYILDVLKEKRKKNRLIKKVGLFGSYAKGTADWESDIDIAIRYKKIEGDEKEREEKLDELIAFMEDIMATFKKHIDFVDYVATRRKNGNDAFIEEIDSYIIWV